MENPTAPTDAKPNIILITVDQMRFPMNFAKDLGINNAGDFVSKYMPNLYEKLWQNGVRFSNYYTAASDCTAARATIHTGLYAYQTYSMLTLITYPEDPPNPLQPFLQPFQPSLHPDFPTIGKLMRESGYDTPYYGKWHLSYDADKLEKYGYNSHTPPNDLVGEPGQGLKTDGTVAEQAAAWFTKERDPNKPFFLNVNFINPHDKQWFWGGMQSDDYNKVYEQIPEMPPRVYKNDNYPPEADPLWDDYQGDIDQAIDNWEDEDRLTDKKPKLQTLLKEVFQYQMGGIFEPDKAVNPPNHPYNPNQQGIYTPVTDPEGFYFAPTPLRPGSHKAIAPYAYWTRALNSYLQVMTMVDQEIGTFMQGVPEDLMSNTIFIFTSDHGEYGSSHGLQGKGGTIYEEGILVPLVVYDPGHKMSDSAGSDRDQLCSSVDLLRMIVSMGNYGTSDWMKDRPYEQLYGQRTDLLDILRHPGAVPARNYVLHTTDEFVSNSLNYLNAPMHVIGMIQMDGDYKQKLGVYTSWTDYQDGQSKAVVLNNPANPNVTQLEYYDFHTAGGKKETDNTATTSPQVPGMLQYLMGGPDEVLPLLATELQVQLPPEYQRAQQDAYMQLRFYEMNVNNPVTLAEQGEKNEDIQEERLLGVWAY